MAYGLRVYYPTFGNSLEYTDRITRLDSLIYDAVSAVTPQGEKQYYIPGFQPENSWAISSSATWSGDGRDVSPNAFISRLDPGVITLQHYGMFSYGVYNIAIKIFKF